MAVEFITYKKQKLPVKVGYYALMMLQKEYGVSMEQLEGNLQLYEPLLFFSLERGHKETNKKFRFEKEDMVDILEECFFEFMQVMAKFFPSDLVEKLMAGVGEDEKK